MSYFGHFCRETRWQKIDISYIPKVIQFTENLFLFDVTARVAAKWGLAHAAGETAHMPAQVVNLQHRVRNK